MANPHEEIKMNSIPTKGNTVQIYRQSKHVTTPCSAKAKPNEQIRYRLKQTPSLNPHKNS